MIARLEKVSYTLIMLSLLLVVGLIGSSYIFASDQLDQLTATLLRVAALSPQEA